MNKIKEFLKKWVVHNIGYKIGALAFAFVLWLVIVNINDPTINRTITNIPVNILHEEKVLDGSRVYTIENGETATITISGNRSIVSTLNASDFVATADFSELSITNAVPITVEFAGDSARYSGSVNITVRTTSMIINIEDMGEKNIPVEGIVNGVPANNVLVENISTSPTQVTLRAPKSILKTAEKAVAYVNAKDVTGDIVLNCNLAIINAQGEEIQQSSDITLNESTVAVSIKTSLSKVVGISITPQGTPDKDMEYTGVTYSKNSIAIRGAKEILDNINEIILPSGLLSIEGKDKDVSITVDVSKYLPNGIVVDADNSMITITATIKNKQEN